MPGMKYRMPLPRRRRLLSVVLAGSTLLAAATHALASTVVYEQTFTTSATGSGSSSNRAVGDADVLWNAYSGSLAIDITDVATTVSNQNRAGVIIGTTGGSPYLYTVNGANGSRPFALTQSGSAFADLLTAPVSVSQLTEIAWNQGNSHTNATVRVLLQIDDADWYASNTTFSNTSTYTGATFDSGITNETADVFKSLAFSPQASEWLSFTLTPGEELALGSASATALSGSVTGIGFHIVSSTSTGSTVRLDNLSIVAIPEPSAYAGLFGAAGLMLALAHRRGRR